MYIELLLLLGLKSWLIPADIRKEGGWNTNLKSFRGKMKVKDVF